MIPKHLVELLNQLTEQIHDTEMIFEVIGPKAYSLAIHPDIWITNNWQFWCQCIVRCAPRLLRHELRNAVYANGATTEWSNEWEKATR
jgi:hypothetical protein